MSEESSRPKVFTIPPTAPFLPSLARAILAGDLPAAGGAPPDRLKLPRWTILLPTRRAARALREAFLAASGEQALLLPRIRPIGDPDEDEALFRSLAEPSGTDNELAGLSPAISGLERRLTLMRLILAWQRSRRAEALADPSVFAETLPIALPSAAQASALAADLVRLLDIVESEEADLDRLIELVPESFADHWQATIDFLKVVTEHWPDHLAESGLLSPIARRNALMAWETRQLEQGLSDGPVIAAGSTGTAPATARLLAAVAKHPQGAVVLPGLDLALDPESWSEIAPGHPEHPQFGMAELLKQMGIERDEVSFVPGTEPDPRDGIRLRLVSEALRPAECTERWHHFIAAAEGNLAEALSGPEVIEASSPQDEAELVALILRQAVEMPGRTAALVTPDRALARRVTARLKGWDLTVDDSAGTPLARTPPGAFLDLVLAAIESNFAPGCLMLLLKHPFARLGRTGANLGKAARALERAAFRDVYVGQGLAGISAALQQTETSMRRRSCSGEDRTLAKALVHDIEAAFAPLSALWRKSSEFDPKALAAAHITVADAVARDEQGSCEALWSGEAGEALALLLAELISVSAEKLTFHPHDYPNFYRSLLAGQVVRPRAPAHPRIFIWGPLEARLQRPDVLVLGGLNDGTWPRMEEAGPWLSRPMRAELGLSAPERRTGLSAHDFTQSLGAHTVYLTRATKVDGVPTVPSRWLQRLHALLDGCGLRDLTNPQQPWLAWARARDHIADYCPVDPPAPKPPVEARPRRLSVTRIEKWIANPYDIFARNILKLEPMTALGKEPGPAERGMLVHQALRDFAVAFPSELPADIAAELLAIADEHFKALAGSTRVAGFWRPQLVSFAHWFAATEPARRVHVRATNPEVDGSLKLDVGAGFELTARADRIDVHDDDSAVIYDYKTGVPPNQKHVDELYAPQLPLEAAILKEGGFEGIPAAMATDLRYIRILGRKPGAEDTSATNLAPDEVAADAIEALQKLIERFDDVETPYSVKRRTAPAFQSGYRYDEYAHLARLKEWAVSAEEEQPD